MNVLVTGAAGFIGFHVARKLLARGDRVVGLDNLNDYYDVNLKKARIATLEGRPNWRFVKLDLTDRQGIATAAHLEPAVADEAVTELILTRHGHEVGPEGQIGSTIRHIEAQAGLTHGLVLDVVVPSGRSDNSALDAARNDWRAFGADAALPVD